MLYDKIPEVQCPDGCTKCCGPVEVTLEEAKRMGIGNRRCTRYDEGFNCEFKTSTGCSVYENRPFVCRLFGTGKYGTTMGCKIRQEAGMPNGPLDNNQTWDLLVENFEIMKKEGITSVDEDTMFALHTHDVIHGFRKDEDLNLGQDTNELYEKYMKWKEENVHAKK
jgi:Fe-S-cluster containining protein